MKLVDVDKMLGAQAYPSGPAGEERSGPAGEIAAATRPGRASTAEAHWRAVTRVVAALRERFADPFSLDEMARIAISSPYHFNRIFRLVTGLPPARFLWALRIQAAKRLLVTTTRSVTDVCFEVGYSSLGTFCAHFAEYVGTSPGRLRHVSRGLVAGETPRRNAGTAEGESRTDYGRGEVSGYVRAPAKFSGNVMIGLFRNAIPRSRPVACCLVDGSGAFRITDVPDGRFYLFAVGLDNTRNPTEYLVMEPALRARAGPVTVRGGSAVPAIDVCLRPSQITDPPILTSLPVLMAERARRNDGVGSGTASLAPAALPTAPLPSAALPSASLPATAAANSAVPSGDFTRAALACANAGGTPAA